MAKKKETFSYDEAVAKVEEILEKLQSTDGVTVDDLVENVDTAMKILKRCKEELGVLQKTIEDKMS